MLGLKVRRCYVICVLAMLFHHRAAAMATADAVRLRFTNEFQGGEDHVMAGAPDNDEAAAQQPDSEQRSATNAMRLIGLGRRASAISGGTSALKYVGLGKRPNAIRYIGLGKRAPERSAMRYIGLGKRAGGERSALRYVGLGKRKSALGYIGLGKKSDVAQLQLQRYRDNDDKLTRVAKRHAPKRGRRRVKFSRRWSSSRVDPALLVMGIGRK